MLTVHVRVTDAATGKPTPVRLRILDAEGVYHAPLGRQQQFATGPGEAVGGQVVVAGKPWAYVDGTCEARLPPGLLTVEICKGVEYRPLRQEVRLAPGQISLRFTIERWTDARAEGWYAGDMRAHELSPHAALLEGEAEGLAVVQLLTRAVPDLLAFSGTRAALSSPECHVVVNTINSHPVLGTVGLLDSHRPVFPLRFGAPEGLDDWSVADWCDQCHRKRGFVTWPDLPRLTEGHPQGEALAALVLGKIDAYEVGAVSAPEPVAIRDYYRLLDCDLNPVLVAASGKECNSIPLGALRTYAQLLPDESLTAETWITNARCGRTFVTNGPLVSLLAYDSAGPGARVRVQPGQVVELRAEARSAVPFDRLELVAGGEIVGSTSSSEDRLAATLETDYVATKSTWIALRCYSRERLETGSCVYAHSNHMWLDVADRPFGSSSRALASLLDFLARTRTWVEVESRCDEKPRQHLLAVLDDAGKILQSRRGR